MDLIAASLLMIVGRAAETSWMSVEALHWIEDAVHSDLYDKDEYVTPAIGKLNDFFRTHLGETGQP